MRYSVFASRRHLRVLSFALALLFAPSAWALSISQPTAATKPTTAFAIPGLTDCVAIGQVYDIEKETCAPAPVTTATDVMGPLIGTSGDIIDPQTIEDSMKGNGSSGQGDAAKKSTDNTTCSSGTATANCADSKRLCALIPDSQLSPQEYPEAIVWALLAMGVIYHTRRRCIAS